jgi:hypothetical protein
MCELFDITVILGHDLARPDPSLIWPRALAHHECLVTAR